MQKAVEKKILNLCPDFMVVYDKSMFFPSVCKEDFHLKKTGTKHYFIIG